MTEPIDPIDEEEEKSRRITAWADVYHQFCNPVDTGFVRRSDLSVKEVDLLDRTAGSAQRAIAQTEFASPADQLRKSVAKRENAGEVGEAAKSAGVVGQTKLRSLFDLSAGNTMDPRRPSDPQKQVRAGLEGADLETVKLLREGFSGKERELRTDAPELAPPRGKVPEHYLLLVLHFHEAMEQVIGDCADHLDAGTQRDLKELARLREEKIRAIEEFALELRNQGSWDTLGTVAKYFAYGSAIAIGIALSSTGVGSFAGPALIAGGAIGAVSSAASDYGVWKAVAAHASKSVETQRQIVQAIEIATTLLSIGLTAAGGIGAYQAGALTMELAKNHAAQGFALFANLLAASAIFGKNWTERQQFIVRAEIQKFDTLMMMVREKMKALDSQTQQTFKLAQIVSEETERMIAASEISLANQ